MKETDYQTLAQQIKTWGQELGFQQVGITDIDLSDEEPRFQAWLDQGYHADMDYMSRYGMNRARPAELLPGTIRAICVRMDYLPPDASFAKALKQQQKGYISRYALGRDYHKLMRKRLKKLGDKIAEVCPETHLRPFVDSAPILEGPLAAKAGIGWAGKHSLIINEQAGSWFFLGEILVNLPLPVDQPVEDKCGECVACITICPTQAIVAPHVVDANRCISYLTIENKGAIAEELRPLIGNRIYGCDDCQLICPWNRYANLTKEGDFTPRTQVKDQELVVLFNWTEPEFLKNTEGSAIRRIGYVSWLRNIAVAMGNAPFDSDILSTLEQSSHEDSIVVEHVTWAIKQQRRKQGNLLPPEQRKLNRLVSSIEKGLPRDA